VLTWAKKTSEWRIEQQRKPREQGFKKSCGGSASGTRVGTANLTKRMIEAQVTEPQGKNYQPLKNGEDGFTVALPAPDRRLAASQGVAAVRIGAP